MLKKISALAIIVPLISLKTFSQTPAPPKLPVDSDGNLITYTAVVELANVSKADIYKRAWDWCHSYYKNPTEVIRENDTIRLRITAKPRFRIFNLPDKEGTKTDGGYIMYTLTLSAKDGKYKYELTAFNQVAKSYFACEKWMDKNNQYYNKNWDEYLRQLDEYARNTVASLKNSMSKPKTVKDKDDW